MSIIGHKNIINFLNKNIAMDSLAHFYILSGPPHIGKKTIANKFIKSILCLKNNREIEKENCDCLSCHAFKKNIHPDLCKLSLGDGKKNIIIEDVRNSISYLGSTSALSKHKILLIKNGESLNVSSSNSLLKTMEEPSEKKIIILVTKSLGKILETIQSRARIINFQKVSEKKIRSELIKRQIDIKKAEEIARAVNGLPGLALSYLEKPSLWEEYQGRIILTMKLFLMNEGERLSYIDEIGKEAENYNQKLAVFEELFSDLKIILSDTIKVKNFNPQFAKNGFSLNYLNKIAKKINPEEIVEIGKNIKKSEKMILEGLNPVLAAEKVMLSFE